MRMRYPKAMRQIPRRRPAMAENELSAGGLIGKAFDWIKGKGGEAVKNAGAGLVKNVSGNLQNVKLPPVSVGIDEQTKKAAFGIAGLLAGGLIVSQIIKHK